MNTVSTHLPHVPNKFSVMLSIGNLIAAGALIFSIWAHSSDNNVQLTERVTKNESDIANVKATNIRQDQAINDMQARMDNGMTQLDTKISRVDDKTTKILEIVIGEKQASSR